MLSLEEYLNIIYLYQVLNLTLNIIQLYSLISIKSAI